MTTSVLTLARSREELAVALGGAGGTRSVVMTMGALHAGHAALVRAARRRTDHVTVTIFVNPMQFGPGEDLKSYPRTLDADLALCADEGVDVVFAPQVVHAEPPLVHITAGALGEVLEGEARPGHFDGVLTVVATLLHLTRPDLAFFGCKDAQQLTLVRRMVRDLAFGVEIVGVPTVRDPDGLALSSRNTYLAADQRRTALALHRSLEAGTGAAAGGRSAVLAAAGAVLAQEPGVDIDYLALVDPDDLRPATEGDALLLVAARVGATRLIDNIALTLGKG